MCTAGQKLQARVVSLTTVDGAEVELIDNSSGHPIMISEILINKSLTLKKEAPSSQNMLLCEFPAIDFQGRPSCCLLMGGGVKLCVSSVPLLRLVQPHFFHHH